MTEQEKQMVLQFFWEKVIEMNSVPHKFTEWLMEYFLKSKAEQLKEITDWLDARLTKNTNELTSLETNKIASENALTSENALINNLKNIL